MAARYQHAACANSLGHLRVVQGIANQAGFLRRNAAALQVPARNFLFAARIDIAQPEQNGKIGRNAEAGNLLRQHILFGGGKHRLTDFRVCQTVQRAPGVAMQAHRVKAAHILVHPCMRDRLKGFIRHARALIIRAHGKGELRVVVRHAFQTGQAKGGKHAVAHVDGVLQIIQKRTVPVP